MRKFPFHPVGFAAFPVIFLFAENAHRVRFGSKVVLPLLVTAAGAVALWLVASLVLRDARRGAIAASGMVLLALSYGHVWNALRGVSIGGVVVGRDLFLLPIWAIVAVLAAWVARRVRSLDEATAICNALAVGMLVVAGVGASTAVSRRSGEAVQARVGEESTPVPAGRGDDAQRDVYYLVFDRYGSASVLERYLGLDNSAFVTSLRERGFYVDDESRSNYPTTAHSLASSLNMELLGDLARRQGPRSSDWGPLYDTIVGPEVSRFLQARGYTYAHIGPWYDPTAHDPTAHLNYHYDRRSEFTRVLLETTIAQPLAKRVGLLEALDGRRQIHNQILFQLDAIGEAAGLEGPTFTFAHILLPHEPFTFAPDGSYVTESEQEAMTFQEGFRDQTLYTNRRILEIVDRLLDGPDDEHPIVVIQADEGPKPFEWTYGGERRWTEASDDELDLKFGILNAYYLPGADAGLYPGITPVNSFRKIFNAYFGAELQMLPDRSYVYGNEREPYRLTDVTDRLNRRRSRG